MKQHYSQENEEDLAELYNILDRYCQENGHDDID